VGVGADKGLPFMIEHPDSAAAKAFSEVVEAVEAYVKQREQQKNPNRRSFRLAVFLGQNHCVLE